MARSLGTVTSVIYLARPRPDMFLHTRGSDAGLTEIMMAELERGEAGPMRFFLVPRARRRAEEVRSSGAQRALLGFVTCVVVILAVLLVGGVLAVQIHSHIRPIVIH
jgi:hypothetical protein